MLQTQSYLMIIHDVIHMPQTHVKTHDHPDVKILVIGHIHLSCEGSRVQASFRPNKERNGQVCGILVVLYKSCVRVV